MFSRAITKLFNKLFIHSVWEGIKTYVLPLLPISWLVCYMIDNLLTVLSLLIGISIIIWLIKSQLYIIAKIDELLVCYSKPLISNSNEQVEDCIKNKLFFVNHDFIVLSYGDTKFIHLGAIVEVYNYSDQLIETNLDLKKTVSVIKDPSINNPIMITDRAKDLTPNSKVIPPKWTHKTLCSYITFPIINGAIILDIDIVTSFKYGKIRDIEKHSLSLSIKGRYMFYFDSTGKMLSYKKLPTIKLTYD